MATVNFKGNPVNVAGHFPQPGEAAHSFMLVDGKLNDVPLSQFAGKKKVLSIVPSIDTEVCATSTRKFNAEAGSLANTVVLVVSADLPFAAKRFCTTEGLNNVETLSTFRSPGFGRDYGVAIASGGMAGLTTRAVVVIDENDKVIHAELVSEIKNEPDYAAALAVLK